MILRLLGPVEVADADGRPVPLGGRERTALAALALAGPAGLSREALVDQLWPTRAPVNSLNVLRNVIMRLRRSLGEQTDLTVDSRPGGYVLRAAADACDVDIARTLIDEAADARIQGDHARRVERLAEAVTLWRGPAFDGLDELEGVASERARLDELGIATREQWVDALLDANRAAEAVVALDALCVQYPLRELLWQQRVLALHRLGRTGDAMDVAKTYRRILRDELGLEPGPNWRRLEQAVLSHDPDLQPPTVDRPTGDVTFVRLEFDPPTSADADWPHAITELGEVIGGVVAAHGGVIFEHGGSRMSAAFGNRADALRAAVAAVRAAKARGASNLPRVGVHSDEATAVDGRYVALGTHVVERIAAAAHPGQVLVSDSAVAPQPRLADDLVITALGSYRIVGHPDEVQLHQAAAVDDATTFPPPRALPALQQSLPQRAGEFVGREEELVEVSALVATTRLVTIVGPAGVGKTRLAVEVAARAAEACFAALAPVTDPHAVPLAVADALGVRTETEPLLDIATALSARPVLLVLDNCEHVTDGAAEFVANLLTAYPDARVLATSRESLGLDAEATWRLAPLTVPPAAPDMSAAGAIEHDAVRLFAVRLRDADPSFVLDDDNATVVSEVVRALDGLPLALELAAPIVGALGITELRRGLDDRLDLLEAAGRRGDPRHHLLRTALEWSYSLLGEPERSLFRRLGVFAGPVDLDTINSVCGDETLDERVVRRAVVKLVQRSLVMRVDEIGASRFGLLETMKVYSRELLRESGDDAPVQRRHAGWVTRLASELRTAEEVFDAHRTHEYLAFASDLRAALQFLATDDPDAALDLFAESRSMWDWMSRWDDLAAILDTALASAERTPTALRAGACQAKGFALIFRDLRAARDALLEAARLYAEDGNISAHALATQRLAGVFVSMGDLPRAREYAERARALNEEHGHAELLVFCEQEFMSIGVAQGDFEGVVRRIDAVLPRTTSEDVAALRWQSLKARLLARLGRTEEAIELAERVEKLTRETPAAEPFNTWVRVALAQIELRRGNLAIASRHIIAELNDTLPTQSLRLSWHLHTAADIAEAGGAHEEAVTLWGVAATMRDRAGELPSRGGDGEREFLILRVREHLGAHHFHVCWRRGVDLAERGYPVAFARATLTALRAGDADSDGDRACARGSPQRVAT